MNLDGFIRKRTTIIVRGKELIFTELSLQDLALFKNHITKERERLNITRRERLLKGAKEIGSIDPVELLKLYDSSISEEELDAQMQTVEGLGYLAYLSLKYEHANISREEVMTLVTPSLIEKITEAMLPTEEEDKKKVPLLKTTKRKHSAKLQR